MLRHPLVRAGASIAVIVVVSGSVYAVVPMRGRFGWLGAVAAVGVLLLLAPLTLRRARSIAVSEHPVADAAVAIAFLLTLLVLAFAGTYVVLADHPGQLVGLETKIDAVYFALTTLSTVGFGDVHAVGQAARVVVSLQVVIDLAFLALAVRLLTGLARSQLGGQARGWRGDGQEGPDHDRADAPADHPGRPDGRPRRPPRR